MLQRRLIYGAIALTLSGVLVWRIAPSFSSATDWQPVSRIAPSGVLQHLRQDYAPHIPPNMAIDVGQMQMLKLQQSGSLPLYLINTRVHLGEHPGKTPTCGTGGCLFLGYIPHKNGFKQVFNAFMNDFQVRGQPPVIQSIPRVLNNVPCFQLTTYNARTQKMNPTQILCFNGGEFVPAEKETQQ